MDPLSAIKLLSKLVQLGLQGVKAWTTEGLGDPELSTLNTLVGVLGEFSGKADQRSVQMSALQLALISNCFGQALARHWASNQSLVPPRSRLRRFFMTAEEKNRAEEIDLRMKLALSSLKSLANPGDLPAGPQEWRQVEALTGSPLATPYYRVIWHAFTNPNLEDPEDPRLPLIDLEGDARLEFERHFLLAYHQELNSAAGQPLQEYLRSLSGDYLGRLLRELLLKDMERWGERHIFRNVSRHEWSAEAGIPFLPLARMYVEPDATAALAGEKSAGPVISLIEALLKEPKKHVLIVKADFGMGKSLTARTLAQRWAHQFLIERQPSSELILPVFIRCAEDLPSDDFNLEQVVRRAWKRQASNLDLELKTTDAALAPPEKNQRTVFLIDGLDEVIFDERRLKTFFERVREQTSSNHRFILLSRPGALPPEQDLEDTPVIEILPWREKQIDGWLGHWRQAHEGAGPTLQELKARQLVKLASTPILLFMIAQTWSQDSQGAGTSLSALYEGFFSQIAKGKHDVAREKHRNIYEASKTLREHLIKKGLIDQSSSEPDAMLWLMSRVAWEATKHEQRRKFLGDDGPEELTEREIDNLIEQELGIRAAPETFKVIQVGLLLSMQAHMSAGRASRLLFGHKTFREFLVARYWADRLRALAQAREREWEKLEESLLDGRLLSREDRTFEFLLEMLNGKPLPRHSQAPFGLAQGHLRELTDWAQHRFASEEQRYPPRRPSALREDRMPWLREAALAIGSCLEGSVGVKVEDALTVRTMLAWFWLRRIGPIIIAPKVQWKGALLSELSLRGANFREADLRGVHFTGADLRAGSYKPCDFTRARLEGANLLGALCDQALFVEASLMNANLEEGVFQFADFSSACLRGASLSNANLKGARLKKADLSNANLSNAYLRGASLAGADLSGASLHGVDLSFSISDWQTRWPRGFDPQKAGAFRSSS